MIVSAGGDAQCLVWNLESDKLWKPTIFTNLSRAVWDSSGERIAAYDGKSVVVLAYPSGEEQARMPAISSAPSLAFSPDDRWLTVGGTNALLWDWRTGEQRRLPAQNQAPERFCFSKDGKSLIVQTANRVGVWGVENPDNFRHPPMTDSLVVRAEFLGDGSNYLTGDASGNIFVRDSLTGNVIPTGHCAFSSGRTDVSS